MPLKPEDTLLLRAAMGRLAQAEKLVDILIDLVSNAPPQIQNAFLGRFRAEYNQWLNEVMARYDAEKAKVQRALDGTDYF